MYLPLLLLLKLLMAHILGDFVFQTKNMVAQKFWVGKPSNAFLLHISIHGILSWIALGLWGYLSAIIILITHFLIDWWKIQQPVTLKYFVIDQLLHLVVILSIWLFHLDPALLLIPLSDPLLLTRILIVSMAFLVVIYPANFIISLTTAEWRKEITKDSEESSAEGLNKAGRIIGILERCLIVSFVLLSQFSAIGFLVAAKSILRFNDRDEQKTRKWTEYILIGTFLSLLVAITIGLIARELLLFIEK